MNGAVAGGIGTPGDGIPLGKNAIGTATRPDVAQAVRFASARSVPRDLAARTGQPTSFCFHPPSSPGATHSASPTLVSVQVGGILSQGPAGIQVRRLRPSCGDIADAVLQKGLEPSGVSGKDAVQNDSALDR